MSKTGIRNFITGNNAPKSFDLGMLDTQLSVLNDFCQSSGLDFERICNDYIDSQGSGDNKLTEALHQTEAEELISEYYSTNTQYLLELTLHECSWNYKKLFEAVTEFAKKKKY